MNNTAWTVWCLLVLTVANSLNAFEQDGETSGRYGKGWDANKGQFFVAANERLGRAPLTIECWCKVGDVTSEKVLLCNGVAGSGEHWEIAAEENTGRVLVRLSNASPVIVASTQPIAVGEWSYLAVVLDEQQAKIFLDAKLVANQPISWRNVPRQRSELAIGGRVEDRRSANVSLDEIRISDEARDILSIPEQPFTSDRKTILYEGFEGSEDAYLAKWTPGGETHQRGLPYPHRVAEYEHTGEDDWIDGRWQATNKGPFVCHTTLIPGYEMGAKTCAVFFDRDERLAGVFDERACGFTAWVSDADFQIDPARYGMMRKPSLLGKVDAYTPAAKVWRSLGTGDAPESTPPSLKYKTLVDKGDNIQFEYELDSNKVVETAWATTTDGQAVFVRNIRFTPTTQGLSSYVLTLAECEADAQLKETGVVIGASDSGEHAWSLIKAPKKGVELAADGRDVVLKIKPVDQQPIALSVALWVDGRPKSPPREMLNRASADQYVKAKRWRPLPTVGKLAENTGDAAYVVDDLTVPFDNPYKALFYISAIDFFPNGDAAVCTVHGDVWILTGIDESLQSLTWHRFATGLYQPLGLRVIDGHVFVLGRDQITRLVDVNNDLEADRYESVNSDLATQGQDHAYAMRLEKNRQGDLFLLKSSEGSPHGSSMLKLDKATGKLDVFAKGFRHPYGMGIGPNDELTVADNEGNWVPASKIDWIEPGGFYGYLESDENTQQLTPRRPLCYIPKPADNSCGGQNWYLGNRWGPYHQGGMLHLSWGRCTLHSVLMQQVGDVRQAATVRFPDVRFHSGSGDAEFSPKDGQLYVVGLNGWQTAAERDGCLERVRYTGKPVYMPDEFAVHADGVHLRFTQPLDLATAKDTANYYIEAWNYHWSAIYGSYHYKLSAPEEIGHDVLTVSEAIPDEDGRGVFLRMSLPLTVDQLQIRTNLRSLTNVSLRFEINGTVNAKAPPFLPKEAQFAPFRRDRLIAWCIVPFDAKQRSPEERAQMLVELGLKRIAYDWREKHIPEWEEELAAYKRHGIELTAFWAPINSETPLETETHWPRILNLLAKHDLHPQLWMMLGDHLVEGVAHEARPAKAAGILEPVARLARQQGCVIGLYNHGGWFGDGAHQIQIIDELAKRGVHNVGVVYNFHHGHEHAADFAQRIEQLAPHLIAVNLNGMRSDGPKILTVGEGQLEKEWISELLKAGYRGPFGVLNHKEDVDARVGLEGNLTGLETIVGKLKRDMPSGNEAQ